MVKGLFKKLIVSPWGMVGIIVIAITLWIGSSLLIPSHEDVQEPYATGRLKNIKLQEFNAIERSSYISHNGVTEPKELVIIKAEAEGKVIEILAKNGDFLKKNDPILRIDTRSLKANLDKAKAALAQNKLNYHSAEAVFNKGLSSKSAIAEAEAKLKSAESQVAEAEIALHNTLVCAPFDGRLDQTIVHVGDLVRIGDKITTIATNAMMVVAYVPEHDISRINADGQAVIKIRGNDYVKSPIIFVSKVGDPVTRSFRVESLLNNSDGKIFGGETASIKIPTSADRLHKLPSSALNISIAGELSVKTVTAEKIVKSYPVEIVEEETDGVWLKGLPDKVNVILVGQALVVDGDTV